MFTVESAQNWKLLIHMRLDILSYIQWCIVGWVNGPLALSSKFQKPGKRYLEQIVCRNIVKTQEDMYWIGLIIGISISSSISTNWLSSSVIPRLFEGFLFFWHLCGCLSNCSNLPCLKHKMTNISPQRKHYMKPVFFVSGWILTVHYTQIYKHTRN